MVGREEVEFARMNYSKDIKDLDNKIIECTFKQGQWVFLRERTDKTFGNSYDTAKGKTMVQHFLFCLWYMWCKIVVILICDKDEKITLNMTPWFLIPRIDYSSFLLDVGIMMYLLAIVLSV